MSLPVARLRAIVLALIFLAAPSTAFARETVVPLSIRTATGVHVFYAEVARSESERDLGLMNRKSLPSNRGMIFVFPRSQPVAFWMKNTLIPLDMIFVKGDGVIAGVKANAKPLSEAIIPSPGPVRFVVELNGGEAARISARPGDKVESGVISNVGGK